MSVATKITEELADYVSLIDKQKYAWGAIIIPYYIGCHIPYCMGCQIYQLMRRQIILRWTYLMIFMRVLVAISVR